MTASTWLGAASQPSGRGKRRAHGWRVLDLMCGTAEVSLGLARQGLKVLGVDRSPAMLAVGAERLAAAADYLVRSLGLAQGNAYNVPAGDLAFFGSHDLEPFGRWSSDLLVLATRQGTS